MKLLTVSAIKAFAACPRFYMHAYENGVRVRVASASLRIGSVFHAGAEAFWLARRDGAPDPLGAAMDCFDADRHMIDDPYAEAAIERLLVAYCARWMLVKCTVLEIEAQFRMPLRHPRTGDASADWELGGKIDLLLKMSDGRTMLCEHKTSSRDVAPGSTYVERLALDVQLDVYLAGVTELGYRPDGILYDIVKKTSLKPLLATPNPRVRKDGMPYAGQRVVDETPSEYGGRVEQQLLANPLEHLRHVEIGRTADQASANSFDLWAWALAIDRARADGYWPRNSDACFRWGNTPCEFFGVCSGRASINDPHVFKVVGAHVELRDEDEKGRDSDAY